MDSEPRPAGQAIVEQLAACGADLAFGVPGESYLDVLDALRDSSIRFVTCRQEGGAGYAAEATAKLTGRPGVVLVTRGPGATNVSVAVHTAQQDETPLLVLVGLIPTSQRHRDAFQEFELAGLFGSMSKATYVLDDPDAGPELIRRAWITAVAGRPGPVVVGLPEDVLARPTTAAVVAPGERFEPAPPPGCAERVLDLLRRADRPLVLVGGSRWDDEAIGLLDTTLAGVPVATSFRRQDLVDHRSPRFVGTLGLGVDPTLVARCDRADLVVVIGDTLGDATTAGSTRFGGPVPSMPIVQVHPDEREVAKVYSCTLGVVSTPGRFLQDLARAERAEPLLDRWTAWRDELRQGYERWSTGGGEGESLARTLRDLLADDAIVTTGAGNFTRPLQRAFRFGRPGRFLAPVSGSMGYGLPAALAASLVHPDRSVVAVVGDGELFMTVQELATVAHTGATVGVIVVDNGRYGTIRTHQDRRFPGRPFAVDLTNPDVASVALAFGMAARQATGHAEAEGALRELVAGRGSWLLHWRVDA
ncbi:MAG: thiamine pyrophosphate-binding protein [Ilumatobacteraceae bacterium]